MQRSSETLVNVHLWTCIHELFFILVIGYIFLLLCISSTFLLDAGHCKYYYAKCLKCIVFLQRVLISFQ